MTSCTEVYDVMNMFHGTSSLETVTIQPEIIKAYHHIAVKTYHNRNVAASIWVEF